MKKVSGKWSKSFVMVM